MKKAIKILGALFAVIFIAMLVVPFVVDVDKYRPQIVQAANDNLNGKLEIGKLKLSLWGKILIKIDGVQLFDASQHKVLSVEQAYFHIPFTSFLSGSPQLTFNMQAPQIEVIKDKTGKLNLMSLMKVKVGTTAAPTAAAPTTSAPPQKTQAVAASSPSSTSSASKIALPAIASTARLSIELRNALLTYNDLGTGLKSETKNLNLLIHDVSLSRPTEIEFWADLDTKMAKVFTVKGPARIKAEIKPTVSGGEFQKAEAKLDVNLDDLEIGIPGTFQKSKGIPTNAHIEAVMTQKDVNVQKFNLRFHNAEINATAQVVNVPSSVKATISSNTISMGPWVELLPALKGFDLSGSLQLKAAANGPTDKLAYSADIELSKLSAKAPVLKGKPEIDAVINVVTDQVRNLSITFKAPGCDLRAKGSVISFSKPRIQLNIDSSGIDLEKLVNFDALPKKDSASNEVFGISSAYAAKETEAPNFDAMLAPLRSNAALREMVASINLSIKEFKSKTMVAKNIASTFTFKNLVANLEKFEMSIFSGKISAKLLADLKPNAPTYNLNAQITDLNLKEAVASSMESLKNTVYGKMTMSMSGTGASFNAETAKQRLNVRGKLNIKDAVFTSIDIGKMVSEGIGSGLAKVSDKIPGLKGKKAPGLPGKEAHYDSITSDFTIVGGKFSAPNFLAKASKGAGVDLKGDTGFGLLDQALHARWEVIDTQNLTKARDLSVDINGTKVNHILAKGNDPVSFPVTVSGTLSAPNYSYSEVPEYFTKIAMGNMAGAAKGRAKDEILKRVGGSAPAPAKKLLDSFSKKLFGN